MHGSNWRNLLGLHACTSECDRNGQRRGVRTQQEISVSRMSYCWIDCGTSSWFLVSYSPGEVAVDLPQASTFQQQ